MRSTTYGRGLRSLSLLTVLFLAAAMAMAFFYAPLDAEQGFIQKIFYLHVPLAIVWAKASWGHWWLWNEPTLVSFLIVILLFCTYQPLRFSIEDPERQARYAAVFAITCAAFVPLNFIAVRLSTQFVHPRVLTLTGSRLPPAMGWTFLVSLIGFALLYTTMWKYEMTAKNVRSQVRRLRRTLLGDDMQRPYGRSAAPL
jgi:heme exporter protein C